MRYLLAIAFVGVVAAAREWGWVAEVIAVGVICAIAAAALDRMLTTAPSRGSEGGE